MNIDALRRLVADMRAAEDDDRIYWGDVQPDLLEIVACSLADRALRANAGLRAACDELVGRVQREASPRLAGDVEAFICALQPEACKLGALVGVEVARHLDVEGTYAAVGRLAGQAITLRPEDATEATARLSPPA